MQKVMLTLPDDLLDEIDRVADQINQNRSEFVRTALREHLNRLRKKEKELLMAEGYLEMAKENEKDAKAYLKATRHLGEQ